MKVRIGQALVIVGLLLVLLSGFAIYGPSLYILWQSHVPSYPRAEQLKTDMQKEGAFETTVIRFATADPPSVICPFYEQQLSSQGWERILPAPLGSCFFILRPMRSMLARGQPVHSYILSIEVRPGRNQQTFVQLQRIHTTLALPDVTKIYP